MASKRSQVRSNLPVIETNQPVARVIDTFAPAAPPPKRPNNTANILKTLISFGQSQTDKILARQKAEQEALEKQERDALNLAFLENPDQFAQDLRLGKFKNLTSPAQLLAGEHMGVRLARKYNVFLREEYAKEGLAESDDASAFFEFENGMRTKFIQENGDAFTIEGVSAGFSKNFRQYIQSLDSTHTTTANTNLKTNQETSFKDAITSNIDSVLNGITNTENFGKNIRLAQTDAKLGYNFDNNTANSLTTDALITYSQDKSLTYAQRRDILKLGSFIQTSPGSSLSGTKEASFKIGKALVAIDDDERQETDRQTKIYKDKKLRVTDSITSKIQQALVSNSDVELSTVLTADELAQAKEFYPGYLKDFATLQDFFQNQSADSLDGSSLIEMRQELSTATSRANAMKMLNGLVAAGKLKGDATAFGTLFSQVQQIPLDEKAKAPKPFSSDPYFRQFYSLLGGVITDTGSVISTSQLPENNQIKLEFLVTEFVPIYLSDNYKNLSDLDKFQMLQDLYNKAKEVSTPQD